MELDHPGERLGGNEQRPIDARGASGGYEEALRGPDRERSVPRQGEGRGHPRISRVGRRSDHIHTVTGVCSGERDRLTRTGVDDGDRGLCDQDLGGLVDVVVHAVDLGNSPVLRRHMQGVDDGLDHVGPRLGVGNGPGDRLSLNVRRTDDKGEEELPQRDIRGPVDVVDVDRDRLVIRYDELADIRHVDRDGHDIPFEDVAVRCARGHTGRAQGDLGDLDICGREGQADRGEDRAATPGGNPGPTTQRRGIGASRCHRERRTVEERRGSVEGDVIESTDVESVGQRPKAHIGGGKCVERYTVRLGDTVATGVLWGGHGVNGSREESIEQLWVRGGGGQIGDGRIVHGRDGRHDRAGRGRSGGSECRKNRPIVDPVGARGIDEEGVHLTTGRHRLIDPGDVRARVEQVGPRAPQEVHLVGAGRSDTGRVSVVHIEGGIYGIQVRARRKGDVESEERHHRDRNGAQRPGARTRKGHVGGAGLHGVQQARQASGIHVGGDEGRTGDDHGEVRGVPLGHVHGLTGKHVSIVLECGNQGPIDRGVDHSR